MWGCGDVGWGCGVGEVVCGMWSGGCDKWDWVGQILVLSMYVKAIYDKAMRNLKV